MLERFAHFIFLIRPRRFGKSLFLSMLDCYYDVAYKDRFDEIFGNTYIGKNPTPERNSYLILSFNFSAVSSDMDKLEESFEDHCNSSFHKFTTKYITFFDNDFSEKLNISEKYLIK